MRANFFSKQELMAMPYGKLVRLVSNDGVQTPDEEKLVNEIMDAKRGFAPRQQTVTLRKDIDIVDQRQEKQWEDELALRIRQIRPDLAPMNTAPGTPHDDEADAEELAEPVEPAVPTAEGQAAPVAVKKERKPRTKKAKVT